MATLTEAAYYTRRAINAGIIILVILLVTKVILDITVSTWRRIRPPPPPPPTVAFGKLPAIKFPQSLASPSAELNFTLETIEGKLPIIPSIGTVFFTPNPLPNLLALTRAHELASRLGFGGEPQPESQTVYRWQNAQEPLRVLRIDIVSGDFNINYDYSADLSLFAEKNLPTSEQAIAEAKNFLQNLGLLSSSLMNGEAKVSYWRLVGNILIQTTSLSNADAVRVDLAREDILEMRLLPPNSPRELVYFIFSGNTQPSKRFLEVSYKFWEIETDQSATYPLKTANFAWEELKSGGGFVAKLGEVKGPVVIRKIYLAYYYSSEQQNFLQPIFVFEGDPDFIAYLPAISPAWVAQ